MNAHIINIGDELLIGQVVNTNASWMAEALNGVNVRVTRVSVVGDVGEDIMSELGRSMAEADIVLVTGGLGPTKDDITKQVLARLFGVGMVTHEETLARVVGYFRARGIVMPEVNRGQALVLEGCQVVVNEVGTAPCMVMRRGGCMVVSMPGVPFEMKWIMANRIVPMITGMGDGCAILHKTVGVFGMAESTLAERIAGWEEGLPGGVRLAYLPQAGIVRLRLSAYGQGAEALRGVVDGCVGALRGIIGGNIFTECGETLSEAVGRVLGLRSEGVATAESCTAGLVANRIVATAGASAWLRGGVVAYSNDVKSRVLGVPQALIDEYGAVSEEVALAMADGVLAMMGSEWAVSTTGVSGPGGGGEAKPVGLVYIAVVGRNGKRHVGRYVFATTREQHQERTANQALFDLYVEVNG
ncbi:MAG: CinA family nicotinamide mononucleotide deamidase-related protein [Paludibacteraceae bacterium]|nr:CinA family nicotinamide mononucleotide deamidase-related protein [Paludibacteraceae bacterium]